MKLDKWGLAALAVGLFGLSLVIGLINLFPTTQSCIGVYVFSQCIGYYSNQYNGSNFILGLIFIGVGVYLYIFKARRGRGR